MIAALMLSLIAPQSWYCGRGDHRYPTKASLPKGAAALLPKEMAEPGEPFNTSDVTLVEVDEHGVRVKKSPPDTAFIVACNKGRNRILVMSNQGGFALSTGWMTLERRDGIWRAVRSRR
jgi:hypothetical protein